MDFTDYKIERQDEVDNAIYDLICNIVPDALTRGKVKWDMSVIGEIRLLIQEAYIDNNPDITEQEFYPYREI